MNKDMAHNQAGEKLELQIYAQAGGGAGLARAPDGKVILVDGALAGEWVLAEVTQVRKDYLAGQTVQVLETSPHRAEPRCPLFGQCGGCDLMHLEYEAQIEAKAAWLSHALKKVPGISQPKLLASPSAWEYRNRVRLQVGAGGIGFFGRKTHKLVPTENCPVSASEANRLLPDLTMALSKPNGPRPGWIELLAHGGQAFCTLGFSEKAHLNRSRQRAFYLSLTKLGLAGVRFSLGNRLGAWLLQKENAIKYFERPGLQLWAFPGLFCQVNFGVNRLLIEAMLQEAGPGQGRPALDLYCGSGNFSLPLAQAGWRVLGVEGVGLARPAAEVMADWNGLTEAASFKTGPVSSLLRQLNEDERHYDLVVLDPPRAGAKGLMPRIADCKPTRIIYVSCHPAALARDALALADLGYRASALYAADMFPHTGHVEAMLVMERD